MKAINITKEGVLEYYGNRAGYVRDKTAFVDLMFKKADVEEFLSKENGFNIEWQNGIYDRLIKGDIASNDSITLKNCRLYQLKGSINVCMKYIGYNELKDRGFGEPNIEDYKAVYDGNIGTNDLEEIYNRFDAPDKPEGFSEQGIYISDVIELYDDNSSEFYYVNPTNFERLEHFNEPKFEAERTIEKNSDMVPDKAENKAFKAVKIADMAKDMTADEPNTTNTPSEKEETFQVETFRITM